MNPLTNMKNVKKLSEQELMRGSVSSWHDQYKNSAWIFIGGLPFDLTEGDVICLFSQYGEVVNINLVRDKATGKSRGFCFICYEDQRSTILAVDNLNGIKVLGRTIRVDHVADYKAPKMGPKVTAETAKLYTEGCAVTNNAKVKTEKVDTSDVQVIETKPEIIHIKEEKEKKRKKPKKEKKKYKLKKRKKQSDSGSSSSESE